GDEAAREIFRAHFELVRQQAEQHSGQEVKTIGDGFMVAFASARRAVACAVGIQRALVDWNAGVGAGLAPPEGAASSPPTEAIRVRIGLNTGEVIREEEDLFGEAVNAAARIAAKAKGGQILVSEMVKGLMGRAQDFDLVDRGRFRLKGFPERWRLYEVVWQEETLVAAPIVERTPYVGREAERAELRRLLEQSIPGHGALVMIGGEPGVGKTRLTEELAMEAAQRGVTVRTGHCYEMEGAPPYIPFVEMLEEAIRVAEPAALRAALGDSAGEVARILPELRRIFPDVPPPLELPPEQERRYLFNSIREFIERASRANPLLLLMDDLHWADDSTLFLLQHLAQHLSSMPVLVLATYRDVELDVGRPLARTLEALLRQRLAHRISLKRLPEEGVEAMLGALGGQDPPPPLVQAIYSETEGNPFFVEEVFQHLAEEGKLFDAEGRWCADLEVTELNVPEGVRLVLSQRLQRVSEQCRRVLTAAAVIGRGFTFDLLEALGELEGDALLDAVDEAERANLIASVSDGPEARFTFAHELIRQTLVSGLSLPRRQRAHLRTAEAMERVYGAQLDQHAADLAHHLYQAGSSADPQKTVHYLTLAGDRAYQAAAFEEALRHYENALSLAPAEDRHGRAGLLYKRGLALRSLGRWDEALADWREALDAYEALGDAERVGRLARDIAEQLNWGVRFLEGLEISRRGLIALGERDSADRCRLLGMAGSIFAVGGQYAAANSMIGEAFAMAERIGNPQLLGQVLVNKGWLHLNYVEVEQLLDSGQRAVGLLRAAGDLWNLADALWQVGGALWGAGRFHEFDELSEELESLAGRLGHVGAQATSLLGRGVMKMMLAGDLQGMEGLCAKGVELTQNLGPLAVLFHEWLGVVQFLRGRWQEAEEQFQESIRMVPPERGVWTRISPLFLPKAYAGHREEARAMFAEARPLLPVPGQAIPIGALETLLRAVEGLAVLGEREEAANLYPLVIEAMLKAGPATSGQGQMLLEGYAGMAAAAGRQWEKAEQHYQTALRQAHELPHRIAQPEVRRWYAHMLIDRDGPGDRDKAFRLLTEAIEMYRKIGMPKHVEMAEALLAQAR
ncbi:MAG: AAA family ATPase, partial [Chloroflexi bacterium]|nr:AAA family ATPase [Chloroflexota bacterium]